MSAMSSNLALDIRAVLRRPMSELRGFTHPDGRPMTPRQAQTALLDQLAGGNELLAIGGAHSFDFGRRT